MKSLNGNEAYIKGSLHLGSRGDIHVLAMLDVHSAIHSEGGEVVSEQAIGTLGSEGGERRSEGGERRSEVREERGGVREERGGVK